MKVPSSKFQTGISRKRTQRTQRFFENHLSLWSLCSFAATPALLFLLAFSALAATNAELEQIPPLRPARDEIPPTFWEQHGYWIPILAALGLFIIIAAVYFFTRPKQVIVLSPEEEARQALAPLRDQPETGALLSQVSLILRHYLSRAFKLPPGEMTTTDCCRALENQPRPETELAALVGEFLRQCDYRKFAPAASGPAVGAVQRALEIIELAEARLAYLRQLAAATEAEKSRTPPPAVPEPHTIS